MNERTITLSDGSVWEYSPLSDEACRWSRWDHSGISRPCDFVGKEPHLSHGQPLTASDHRAIADILEPRAAASGGERGALTNGALMIRRLSDALVAIGLQMENPYPAANVALEHKLADALDALAALRAAPRSSGTVTREQAEALPTWTPEQIAHFQQEAGGAAFFILRDTVLALFSGVPSAAEGSRKETPR